MSLLKRWSLSENVSRHLKLIEKVSRRIVRFLTTFQLTVTLFKFEFLSFKEPIKETFASLTLKYFHNVFMFLENGINPESNRQFLFENINKLLKLLSLHERELSLVI